MTDDERAGPSHSDFIREVIEDDLRTGKHDGRVVTRFPPEPNGYLHIGHAKAICLNFGVAEQYGGRCNLRFDDTNPLTEGAEYVDSIVARRELARVSRSATGPLYASDYFEEMYQLAEELIAEGKAYVDHLSDEEIRDYRGSLGEPGRPSPYRERTVEENLALFREMRCRGSARRELRAPGQDRSRSRQHEDARPASLPDPPRPPSPNGRRLAHLSDVRLGPSPLRRHRGGHPLDLHARVRKQPRAVRLGHRQHAASPNATGSAGPTSTSSPVSTLTTPS